MDKTDKLKSSVEKIESVYATLELLVKAKVMYMCCCDNDNVTYYWKFFINEFDNLNKHTCFIVAILDDFVNSHSEQEIINLILQKIERRNKRHD